MRHLITGAGQIGGQLADDLLADGHEVVVLRRSAPAADASGRGPRTFAGDAADRDLLRRAAEGCAAIHHCIHAAYDARVWRRELPGRERAVMDVAAELGVPVIFPESVYAFGHAAADLAEGAPFAPVEDKGRVRAELMAARAAHAARTVSVVASDVIGPSATPAASVALSTVIGPIAAGRTAWVLADPDQPHSLTAIPDLTRAMRYAADHADAIAPGGDAIVHAPTDGAPTLREVAAETARIADTGREPRIVSVPAGLLRALGPVNRLIKELAASSYLWRRPAVLRPGILTEREGLAPTPWRDAVASTMPRSA